MAASSMATNLPEYVLGTRDDELARLCRQHAHWRDECVRVWRAVGIASGSRVLDIGSGPGAAAMDLAGIVGGNGRIDCIELSAKYAAAARRALLNTGVPCEVHHLDVMSSPLPRGMCGQYDFTWSRWVSMFIAKPELLVSLAHDALDPSGCAIFHEYVNYGDYGLHPRGSGVSKFVAAVVRSIQMLGGDADVGRRLPGLLTTVGFEIISLRSISHALLPTQPMWEWPSSFILTYAPQLVERGLLTAEDAQAAFGELEVASRSSGSFLVPPTVIEIVARKR